MILVQIIILETAGLDSGHAIGNQCHTALGCLGLVLNINQNIWKETFEDIVDAIIETLSQDYLDTESSTQLSPGIILMSGVVHDTGILLS